MFMKKRNRVAAGMALLLLALAALGCSSGNNSGKTQNTGTPPAAESSKGGDGQTAAKPEPPLVIRAMENEHPSQPYLTDSPSIKEREKLLNVQLKIEAVPSSNYAEKTRTMLATNNIPDIIKLDSIADMKEFAPTGIFLPISDYLDHAPNFKKLLDETPDIKSLMVDGKLYGFPSMNRWTWNGGRVPVIRQDVMDELGLQEPTTYEELFEVLSAFKQAYPDSYPLTFRGGGIPYVLRYFAFNLGSGYEQYYEPETGKYVYGPAYAEDFKPVLEYLHRLYKAELLDPDYAVNTNQSWQEKLSSGQSMFFVDNNSFAINFTKALQVEKPNAQFQQIHLMANHKGQKRGIQYAKHPFIMRAISAKTANPEAVVAFMDWHYSEQGSLLTSFGIEGEHYDMVNGEPVVKQSLLGRYKNEQDPARAMMSAVGTGLLAFTLYNHDGPQLSIAPPEVLEWSKMMEEEPGHHIIPLDPVFTLEENEQLTKLKTKVETLLEQNMDRFVMGSRPLSEYEAFAKELVDAGALEIENIYNTALERMK